jgi:ABC-type transport system involved in cytochrome bd biosynthesis fused ATPase/permease subunit
MHKKSGSVQLCEAIVNKPIAYMCQSAAIVNGTVRENILFGRPFDGRLYEQCIDAACLSHDIALMRGSGGDMTEIGEKGINLSGGQKSRVAFARCLYHKDVCDLYLLDDVLRYIQCDSHRFSYGVYETYITTVTFL